MLMMLAVQVAVSDVSDEWIDRAARRARPVAECQVGEDCSEKWERARRWVRENSRFANARETDDLIVTHGAVYANTDLSFAIVLDPPEGQRRSIRFRAWCGNFITCYPSPKSARRLFRQAMEDVR